MGIFDSIKSGVERLRAADSVSGLKKTLEAERLIKDLKDEVTDIRCGVASALKKIGKPAVEPLIHSLKDEDPNVRGSAAGILGAIGGIRAIEALIGALQDGEPNVRESAVRALGSTGDELVVEHHRQAVKDREPAVEPLIQALNDDVPKVRESAVRALGNIGDERAIEPLIQSLKDKYSTVKKFAAGALVQIGEPAVKLLIRALEDEDLSVRNKAAEVLDKIRPKSVPHKQTESILKALVFNIKWSGQLGWMLDEAFKAKGLNTPELNDIEYIDSFPADEPEKMAEKGASQLRKPGWSCIIDNLTLDYGGRKSHVIIYKS